MRSVSDNVARMLGPILSFVFPANCSHCHAVLDHAADWLCPACWSAIAPAFPGDSILAKTSGHLLEGGIFDGLVVPFYFEKDAALQGLVHQLKYSGCTSIGTLLGRKCGSRWNDFAGGASPDWILPVPLHSIKKRERGYNQSDYIARGLSMTVGGTVRTRILRRARYTNTQTHLTISARAQNVAGAFRVSSSRGSDMAGRVIVIVDDVVTTGATLRECGLACRKAGAAAVIGCAAAIAV
jgi:ComF family protein